MSSSSIASVLLVLVALFAVQLIDGVHGQVTTSCTSTSMHYFEVIVNNATYSLSSLYPDSVLASGALTGGDSDSEGISYYFPTSVTLPATVIFFFPLNLNPNEATVYALYFDPSSKTFTTNFRVAGPNPPLSFTAGNPAVSVLYGGEATLTFRYRNDGLLFS
eukprot:TRINITY_DN1852_c0_g1_i1.p1 TRINITY_DN1852_c0_g1~~TRINITY_DN1852_c0_g1_i1.p1  ORF type:complete len:162 (-),score=40.06 TRINITY_DN1852_c0_g1_i1:70-555(-)